MVPQVMLRFGMTDNARLDGSPELPEGTPPRGTTESLSNFIIAEDALILPCAPETNPYREKSEVP